MNLTDEHYKAVEQAVADIRAIEANQGATRESLQAIQDRLVRLASRTDLFNSTAFPPPSVDDKRSNFLYRLHEDAANRFALYVNSASGRKYETPVHNHKTWAVVVGIAGDELNRIYERMPDSAIQEVRQTVVRPGTGIAFLSEDLHAIRIDAPLLHFHMYGFGFEHQEGRQFFDSERRTWVDMAAHPDIVEARRIA
jgi:predicted metal-dependent enzyme (double-stranded beta helix superfamily)